MAARGAGLIIEAHVRHKSITPDSLRQALQVTLSESRYREAARELQIAVRTMGGYQQAANEIQAYILQKTSAH